MQDSVLYYVNTKQGFHNNCLSV